MTEQISHAVEAIKLAYLSHTPVVWLVTGDREVASEIVETFTVEHFGAFRSAKMPHAVLLREFTDRSSDTSTTPSVFYLWHSGSREGADAALLTSMERFVTCHEHMVVDPGVQAMTEEHAHAARFSLAIIASPSLPPESWVTQYVEIVYVRALLDGEIKDVIRNTLAGRGIVLEDSYRLGQLVVNLRGFSARKISRTILRCILSGFFDYRTIQWPGILREVRLMKRQMLEGFVGLRWIDVQMDNPRETGRERTKVAEGLDAISRWLDDRRAIFEDTERARKSGYDIPKGVLITGLPGTGKSMMAKETARKLHLPLIALDVGDLQEGLVGASEKHLVDALRMVEAMAPCVLWIDEMEKAFSGSDSARSDGGVMRRMFGKFLTWMQEKTAPCFVFATSNDISRLPSELFRSERFDDRFFSFMPMVDECAAIFGNLIRDENARYMENNPEDEWGSLFAVELCEPDVWKSFLNRYTRRNGPVDMDGNKWREGKIPQCKLFTGADISMVVKLVKFRLLKQFKGAASNFSRELVFGTVEEVLRDFMPYGQTNLRDIAGCFVQLSRNRFRSASSASILDFGDYNAETAEMRYDADRYADDYNRVLYAAVVGAVNFYATKTNAHETVK